MTSAAEMEARLKRGRAGSWVRPEVQGLQAYDVSSSEGLVKLDAMENPFAWPEPMQEAWLERLRDVTVNRYPDAAGAGVNRKLREKFDIPKNMDVLLGNGSDELIQIIQLCLAGPGRVVLAPTPSFSMYEIIADFVGMRFVGVPLTPDYEIDMGAMRSAIDEHDPAVVFLAYPNNPTGNLFERSALGELIRVSPGLVVVDEAYHIFAGGSYFDQLDRYDNLVVIRTLSKLGLAGIRMGFMVGPSPWLDEFAKVRLPYNINTLTQVTTEFALDWMDVFEHQARLVTSERERMYQGLLEIDGITPFPSNANFILFRSDAVPSRDLFELLVDHGVLVRHFFTADTDLERCLRVSVGTEQENDVFLAAISDCLR